MHSETVTTPGSSYPVISGSGLLETLPELLAEVCGDASSYVIISDSNVAALYMDSLKATLSAAGINAASVVFAAGEPNKNLATVSSVFDELFAAAKPDRSSVILALGGGVAGDMAGFIAATLLRGVRFVQLPTSLLAAVDSSVGGKTGVDHASGKNLIGAFHQPCGVFMDTRTLQTLPALEISSGLAECVKHACIRQPDKLSWLSENAAALLAGDEKICAELIGWNVAVKAAVVSADEKERGQRAHLNFGHTMGHAIEAVKGMDAAASGSDDYLRHGHCVALGMVAAAHIAGRRNLLASDKIAQLETLLAALDLPVRIDLPDSAQLLDIMRRDKKNLNGRIRFVLPSGDFGLVDIYPDVTDAEINAAIEYLTT